jgi:hypothetical protein
MSARTRRARDEQETSNQHPTQRQTRYKSRSECTQRGLLKRYRSRPEGLAILVRRSYLPAEEKTLLVLATSRTWHSAVKLLAESPTSRTGSAVILRSTLVQGRHEPSPAAQLGHPELASKVTQPSRPAKEISALTAREEKSRAAARRPRLRAGSIDAARQFVTAKEAF